MKRPSVRVIAGLYKGARLKTHESIRPLTGLAKKSLFDILKPVIEGSCFLDLFAGSGAVGIEALSRGAGKADFVEKDRSVYKIIKGNLEKTRGEAGYSVYNLSAERFLENAHGNNYNIIFAGPPYAVALDRNFFISVMKLLLPNGVFICQHSSSKEFDFPQPPFRRKKYGVTVIDFYRRQPVGTTGS